MKNFLAGILFCVLALNGFAQDEYVDSLKREMSNAHDTSVMSICWKIADFYSSSDNELFDNYMDTLLFYSKKYSSGYWEAKAYRSKGLIKYRLGDYSSAVNYYGKAETLAKKLSNPELLYKVYNDLGMVCCELHDFKNSRKYYDMAIDNIKNIDDDAYAITLVNIANLYYDTEEYDKIFALYDSALNITEDTNTRIAILNNKACLQYFNGDIEDAKTTYDKLLSMLDTKVDVYIYTSVLNSMSSIYIREGEYDKAIEYLNEVDSICHANKFDDILMKLYSTYHELYIKIGDFEQAHDYMECLSST
jgi:tetratricopeptide (TPR) repeat protein